MLRNITSHRMKASSLVTVSGLEVRRALDIPTQKSYIDFALLLGTDFTERIKNLGPAAAYKLIKEYGSIENVIKIIQGEVVQPSGSKKATRLTVIEDGEPETEGKKPRKSKRAVVPKALSSRYIIQYPPSEYLAHVNMGREVYSTLPPLPAKKSLEQKPQNEAALSALLREWGIDREQLDGPDGLLEGEIWRLEEGYAWESGKDVDIFERFGGSLAWTKPWEGDDQTDNALTG
jgi:flap endonuclease-1